jgi:hypothetical protein
VIRMSQKSDADFILGLRGLERKDDKIVERHKPRCQLVGEDGNIFNLIGIATRTLKREGMRKEASEMENRILNGAESYDEALGIIQEYLDVY